MNPRPRLVPAGDADPPGEGPGEPPVGYTGEVVRSLRTDRRWTLAELAQKLRRAGWTRVSVSLLSKIELGHREVKVAELIYFTRVFEVGASDFAGSADPPGTADPLGTVELTGTAEVAGGTVHVAQARSVTINITVVGCPGHPGAEP